MNFITLTQSIFIDEVSVPVPFFVLSSVLTEFQKPKLHYSLYKSYSIKLC